MIKGCGVRMAFCFAAGAAILAAATSQAEVTRVKYQAAGNYLVVEALGDELLHLEYGRGSGPEIGQALAVSPMVSKKDYPGPAAFANSGSGVLETRAVRLQIDPATLAVTVNDKRQHQQPLTTLTPAGLERERKTLEATYTGELDIYGLGQQFVEPGNSDLDWEQRVREGGEFGNVMAGFNGGANGNTQIPIVYAVRGASFDNYALFLDNVYKQRWDFTSLSKWKAEVFGGPLRFYLLTGPNLPALRQNYLELVGRPLVPPKKMFGLWVSEYGYDNWGELEEKLRSLRARQFPVDGFVLDLQWFGGIKPGSEESRMGGLTWDPLNFPNPREKLADLRKREGIGVMLIEEAYIAKGLAEYRDLQGRNCLAKKCGTGDPAYLDGNPWWGKGGMIDYTSELCRDYWHDRKRLPLIQDGVTGHWTDLGEPEMYKADSCYAGGNQAEIHNLFNFAWLEGINRGYSRNQSRQRPFMMSRSGTAGIQRFGAAMWSGDIAGRLGSLAAHSANQMHMSFSGIDYYGADIGGFHRNLDGELNEMYTRWYAYAMLFDLPGRPHVENLCNCKETAPDRIGDSRANLANTRLRYELVPYLYSLAHRAYRFGEPVMPPLVYYYQADPNVRHLGQEKLIGRELLAAISTTYGEREKELYLPAGDWFDWYSHRRIPSTGMKIKTPLERDGLFRLPLYARAGAIIPLQFVDEQTMNTLGQRRDGAVHDELLLQVFAAAQESKFILYEDDGQTIGYQEGQVRQTPVTQKQEGERVTIAVGAGEGSYDGASASRNNVIRLVAAVGGTPALAVKAALDGVELPRRENRAAFDRADSGWFNDEGGRMVWLKSGVAPVAKAKEFTVQLAARACASQYQSLFVPGQGNGWNPADPARALSCLREKLWSGRIKLCNEPYKLAADGGWSRNWGLNGQADGANLQSPERGGVYELTFDEEQPAAVGLTPVDLAPGQCGEGEVAADFVCENGHTVWGTSVYVTGNLPELGNWDTSRALRLAPDGPYPTWRGTVSKLPAATKVEWKCIKRLESGNPPLVLQWEPGENNTFTTPAAGKASLVKGEF